MNLKRQILLNRKTTEKITVVFANKIKDIKRLF